MDKCDRAAENLYLASGQAARLSSAHLCRTNLSLELLCHERQCMKRALCILNMDGWLGHKCDASPASALSEVAQEPQPLVVKGTTRDACRDQITEGEIRRQQFDLIF